MYQKSNDCGLKWFSKGSVNSIKQKGLLVCDTTHFDYGKIKIGTIFKRNFKFKNVGKEKVNILQVAPSCSCTNVVIPKKQIGPNESIIIQMEVNTEGKNPGKQSANTVLTTNGQRETYVLLLNYDLIE